MTDEGRKYDREYLVEQYEDALFRLAFHERAMKETEELQKRVEEEGVGVSEETLQEMFQRGQIRLEKELDRRLRKSRRERFFRQTLPKAGKIAAAALLVFFIGGSVAVAAVRPVRLQLMKFLIKIEREYAELSLVPAEGAELEVPDGWTGDYFPAYVPEGFAFNQIAGVDGCLTVQYQLHDGRLFEFGEYDQDTGTNIDIEDAEIQYLEVGGSPALVSEKDGYSTVAWAYADRYFIVGLDGAVDEALQIARSVQKIN